MTGSRSPRAAPDRHRAAATALLVWLLLVGAACSADASEDAPAAAASGATGDGGELIVLAAASLTEAFTRIGADFEIAHPGVEVRFSFGPSDGLAGQIVQGSPADVFASASGTWMDSVQEEGPGVTHRSDFARNRLVIITPADNPEGVTSLADLANPDLKLVLAAPGVPAGDYAREALTRAGIAGQAEANVVSNEVDDKSVVQKVLLGEADAGIVYRTDLTSEVGSQVQAIDIPRQQNVIATYPIAVVADSEHAELATDFVDYVSGPDGQRTLREFSFLPPP